MEVHNFGRRIDFVSKLRLVGSFLRLNGFYGSESAWVVEISSENVRCKFVLAALRIATRRVGSTRLSLLPDVQKRSH